MEQAIEDNGRGARNRLGKQGENGGGRKDWNKKNE